jgi:hypothetical protein
LHHYKFFRAYTLLVFSISQGVIIFSSHAAIYYISSYHSVVNKFSINWFIFINIDYLCGRCKISTLDISLYYTLFCSAKYVTRFFQYCENASIMGNYLDCSIFILTWVIWER